MAHQAHKIPWGTLSSNLKIEPSPLDHDWQTAVFTWDEASHVQQMTHFADAFVKVLGSASDSERAKYPPVYSAASPDEEVIGPEAARTIEATVQKYRSDNPALSSRIQCPPECARKSPFTIALGLEERSMSFWLRDHWRHPRAYCCGGSDFLDSIELIKTLLIHGQVSTLLRISAHPDFRLHKLWSSIGTFEDSSPIEELLRCALMSYIWLNVFLLKPETHDAKSRAMYLEVETPGAPVRNGDWDYRNIMSYGLMVTRCTGDAYRDVHTYLHQEFFGFVPKRLANSDGHDSEYDDAPWVVPWVEEPYVAGSSVGFYKPLASDIPLVTNYLRQLCLPTELALKVLDHASYVPQRILPVAEDPLHIENREELYKYLATCWELLVYCDLLAKANGREIKWRYEITNCLWTFWGDTKLTVELPQSAYNNNYL